MASGKRPHVLIIGAGLGGLLLAQALRKQNVSFQIFERDSSLQHRSQGWCIGIHSFFDELEAAMPDDLPSIDVTSHLRPLDLPAQLCFYRDGQKFFVQSGEDGKVIRANRKRLRDWLATKLEVNWDKRTTRIEENVNSVTVHFADGSSATGDVLVGADGVNSMVRSHIFGAKAPLQAIPQGVIVAETTVDKSQLDRQLSIAHSAYVALGDGFFVFVGLKSIADDAQSATFYWFVIWNAEDAALDAEKFWTVTASKQKLYDFALKKTEGLDKRFTEIIGLTDVSEIVTPPLVIKDLVLEDLGMPGSRITLLGDAAHPMTPFRGEGGSNAMIDALKLARVLAASTPENVVDGLEGYQEEMLRRGGEAVKRSRAAAGGNDGSRIVWGQSVRPG